VGLLGGLLGRRRGAGALSPAVFAKNCGKNRAEDKKALYFLEELVYNNMHQGALGLVFAPKMQRRCR
jgi:hypothetical protein